MNSQYVSVGQCCSPYCCGLHGDRSLSNETVARRRPTSGELLNPNLVA